MAEREARVIGERTKAALAAAKARGVQLGKNGVNLARANKASALAFAETMAGAVEEITAAGAKTLQDIADGLNNRALATREGARWSPMTASRLLARLRDRGRSADPCSASATLAIPYEDCDSLVAAQSLHV
jgi:DNA invertase Pin-like site-specific DNA recombinase